MADKEVLLTALNIKAMSFTDEEEEEVASQMEGGRPVTAENNPLQSKHLGNLIERKNSILGDLMEKADGEGGPRGVPIVVDLAFASNVRFLDDHELHLDNVELYKVLRILCESKKTRNLCA